MCAFYLGPMIASFIYSFTDYPIIAKPHWAGLENYRTLLDDGQFHAALEVTAIYTVGSVALYVGAALGLALLCDTRLPGVGMIRTLVFIPSLVPVFGMAILWGWLFNRDFGLANYVLHQLGLSEQGWFQSESQALWMCIAVSFWAIGSAFVVFLAGLQSIPQDLYEAITVDGAGTLRRFWHVTLPMLSPVILFNLVIGMIISFQVFDIGWALTNGGPGERDPVLRPLHLAGRLPAVPDGLCVGPRLGPLPADRRPDRARLPHRALLGALRRGEVVSEAATTPPAAAPGGTSRRRRLPAFVRYLGLVAAAVLALLPLYYILYLALSKSGNEFDFPPHVWPEPIRVQNLWHAFFGTVDYPGNLFHYFGNSILYAGLATLGCLITQSIVGYAFARLRFPGRNLLFGLTVAMLMMPFVVTLIPRFLLFKNLHLTDSLWPLIIPCWFGGTPYGIFLMRQFFMSIPRELDEAARIDGLGHWGILWRILVPQAMPVLVALGILELAYFWNDLLGPLIYTETDSKMPITLGIFAHARTPYSFNYSLFFSLIVLMVLPIALLFLTLQRQFRQGFLFSGLGGR